VCEVGLSLQWRTACEGSTQRRLSGPIARSGRARRPLAPRKGISVFSMQHCGWRESEARRGAQVLRRWRIWGMCEGAETRTRAQIKPDGGPTDAYVKSAPRTHLTVARARGGGDQWRVEARRARRTAGHRVSGRLGVTTHALSMWRGGRRTEAGRSEWASRAGGVGVCARQSSVRRG
jgi:hypothetical protein